MDKPTSAFYDHSDAHRVNTDVTIIQALRSEYPEQHITTIPVFSCDLLSYAASGHATAIPIDDFKDQSPLSLKWRFYLPPARRLDGATGGFGDELLYGKYLYTFHGHELIMYVVNGRDGTGPYPQVINQYVVGAESVVDELILAAGQYTTTLHDEIWVFDQGYWQKDGSLWESIQKAVWENVILDEDMKQDLADVVEHFLDSRAQYERLGVPWKRGMIFHGPPGNGKTISIKATMHMLYDRKPAVPTLFVKTLASFLPPEYALGSIFRKARQEAPCYLVFEDLDSLVTDRVRAFFLNEVDGVQSNDGILMVGSTNHLDRLDPGIAKRPSRFDRKFFFPNPDLAQRVKYCHFWQDKLKKKEGGGGSGAGEDDVEFPDRLCGAIAKITDGFSFAYIQEAFVAALIVIAGTKKAGSGDEEGHGGQQKVLQALNEWDFLEHGDAQSAETDEHGARGGGDDDDDRPDLDKYLLWRVIKKQIAILRKELNDKAVSVSMHEV